MHLSRISEPNSMSINTFISLISMVPLLKSFIFSSFKVLILLNSGIKEFGFKLISECF